MELIKLLHGAWGILLRQNFLSIAVAGARITRLECRKPARELGA
jgi:hypothetical protein